MADKKRTKTPGTESRKDEPFRPATPSHTEPQAVGFEDEPLDLSELDGLLDDNGPGDFPASDTGLGMMPEPAPLPPAEDTTDSHAAVEADAFDELRMFDAVTAEGGPVGVRRNPQPKHETLDASAWDLPNIDEALSELEERPSRVSDIPMPDSGDLDDETITPASTAAREAEAARAAEEHRQAEAAEEARRAEEKGRQAEEKARAEEARAAEAARRAEEEAEQARAKAKPAPRLTESSSSIEIGGGAVSTEFRRESQRLARARDWKKLVELTSTALEEPWAQTREVRATLLADVGRVQRDRLSDAAAAEKTFAALVEIEPAHVDGFAFLAGVYEQRGAWRPLYDLHLAAVEATWDPDERLGWTKKAVKIAEERLASPELSIDAWERLAKLGDAVEETTQALSAAYRAGGRWDRLTDFLERTAEHAQGAERRLQLREVAEASLSGLRDADRAARVLDALLADLPEDPISLLMLARVEARRRNWDALFTLGTRPTLKAPGGASDPTTTYDLRAISADALAQGGEHDRAAQIYDLILRERPGEKEAIEAKERYLSQSGRIAELVDFLADRAASAPEAEKGKLLERAAQIAERDLGKPARAVELWEARAQLSSGRVEALRALEQLHETLGDDEGLRHDLEGQLRLVQSTAQRIELLRRLGRHAAHRIGDDGLAERCWSEILRAVPDDRDVREELVALHRRRGDHASLDRTFEAQAWRPADEGQMRALWRAAAENVEQHLSGTNRSGAAWRRVLDLEPGDASALASIVRHERSVLGTGNEGRALIAALEAQLRTVGASPERVAIGLEIASRWEALGDRAAAAAAHERVLWWSPGESTAIDRLLALREKGQSAALLDRAAAELAEAGPERQALARRQLELLPKDDALGRFYAWRRLYRMAGATPEIVEQMSAEATRAGAFRELEAVLIDLAARAESAEDRRRHHATLAALYEQRLTDPLRALLAMTTARHEPVASLGELEPALKLCDATGRHEDAYALLGVAARHDAPVEVRAEAIRRRAALAEDKLSDPERAFHECARLLVADPRDAQALKGAQRLAGARKLGRALDALYGELVDRADSNAARAAITRARYELRAGELGDAAGALDQLWLLYHLEPSKETEGLLIEAGGAQGAWDRVLAVLEARARAGVNGDGLIQIPRIAKLHESERNDQERALELSAASLVEGSDDASAVEASIERLAAATERWGWLVEAFRAAAARTPDAALALRLYRRVAAVYADKLGQPELALDVHRRILQLDPNDLASLEVSIAHLRSAELWRELRDALAHWVEVAGSADQATLIQRQLAVAEISRDRLGDPERALSTFAAVLDVEAGNDQALQGITSLTGGAMTPELEVRRLRLELSRAPEERRVPLTLQIAALIEDKLDDRQGAIAVLRELVEKQGAAGPGFAPLKALYGKDGAWLALIELLEAHAQAAEGEDRVQALDEALSLAERHATEVGPERAERLCRKLVDARPDDAEARRRLLSLLRESGRFEELADRLEDGLRHLGDPDDDNEEAREMRGLLESELVHLLERRLGKPADAGALLLAQIERRPERPDALLELAGLKLRQGDVPGYLSLRAEHAKTLPAGLAAYVLCHLAEATDEKLGDQAKVLELYRSARAVDATNPAAMDALKAVGRRAKSWRASAALLPEPNERELSWADRSRRLAERGAAARATDPTAARGWLERAIATDPDNHEAWAQLAELARLRHDLDEELAHAREALFAFMRAAGAEPERQADHARRVLAYADVRRRRGDQELAARLAWRAYELKPSLAAAALQVGTELLAHHRDKDAYTIYDRLLGNEQQLAPTERLEATFRRGALRARLGDLEAAIADFRAGLRIEELHPPLLAELARVLAASGRVANAAVHHLQALLFSSEALRRADLYASLGRLFDGALGDADEAGVCFDRSMSAGSPDPQVMLRALGHYRRAGELDRALSVIEHLLPSTKKPEDLAALWAERGRLLSERDPDKAVEAFDMALSYDSSCAPAVAGLAAVLEARGDWAQLLELLEVRAEQGAPEERAEALRGLARIASGHLGDGKRAEGYLRDAIALAPRREDYELLLKTYGDDPNRRSERRDVVAALIGVGGPLIQRVIEVGRELVADGHRQWAWSLLAPLMNTTLSEPALKTMVLDLRKEFEKVETVARLSPRSHELVRPSAVPASLFEVLVEVDELGSLGPSALEGVALGKLDGRTAVGKTFLGLAERLGLNGAQLFRAQELSAPFLVLDGDTPQVVLRADLVQLMAPGETNYLFTLALEHARPGTRLITSLAQDERALVVPALLDVLGIAAAPPEAQAMKERLAAIIPEDKRAALAARIPEGDRAALTLPDAGQRVANGLVETARRVGLIAAADLRFPAKVLTRLDESLPKMPTAGRIDDLEDFLSNAAPVRALVSFAASSQFARALDS